MQPTDLWQNSTGYAVCRTVDVQHCWAPTDHGPMPALVFRFTHVDGSVVPPAALVLTAAELLDLVSAIGSEASLAVKAAVRVIRSQQ